MTVLYDNDDGNDDSNIQYVMHGISLDSLDGDGPHTAPRSDAALHATAASHESKAPFIRIFRCP